MGGKASYSYAASHSNRLGRGNAALSNAKEQWRNSGHFCTSSGTSLNVRELVGNGVTEKKDIFDSGNA